MRTYERVSLDLIRAFGQQRLARTIHDDMRVVLAAGHQRGGDVVVTVQAQHFLGHIGIAFHIHAIARHMAYQIIAVALGVHVQTVQYFDHLFGGHFDADVLLNALDRGGDYLFRLGIGINVHDAGGHVARVQHVNQFARALHRVHGHGGAYTALVMAGCIGAHTQLAAGKAYAGAIERRALEQHVVRALGDFGLLAAHYARKAGGLLTVGDYQHTLVQLAILAVQGFEYLAGLSAAHYDLAVAHLAHIEGVHRVAGFDHYEVGYIDYVIYGAHTGGVQVVAQPLR